MREAKFHIHTDVDVSKNWPHYNQQLYRSFTLAQSTKELKFGV